MKAIAIALLVAGALSHAAEKEKEKVSIEEFGENKVLIGELGQPFGKVIRITCRGIVPTEEEKRTKREWWKSQVEIVAIEGKQVAPPIRMEWSTYTGQSIEKPEGGVSLEVLGYEAGGFRGTPSEVPRHVMPRQDVGFHFECYFVALKKFDPEEKPR